MLISLWYNCTKYKAFIVENIRLSDVINGTYFEARSLSDITTDSYPLYIPNSVSIMHQSSKIVGWETTEY
jgi:hypothetical protein